MSADVELPEHAPAVRVDENDVIGKIVGDEQLVGPTAARDHRQAGRIRNCRTIVDHARSLGNFLTRGSGLRRNLYKAIPGQPAFVKAINRNPISGVVWLLAGRIGDGANRGIKMFAIGTECESNKIALVRSFGESIFRELG